MVVFNSDSFGIDSESFGFDSLLVVFNSDSFGFNSESFGPDSAPFEFDAFISISLSTILPASDSAEFGPDSSTFALLSSISISSSFSLSLVSLLLLELLLLVLLPLLLRDTFELDLTEVGVVGQPSGNSIGSEFGLILNLVDNFLANLNLNACCSSFVYPVAADSSSLSINSYAKYLFLSSLRKL